MQVGKLFHDLLIKRNGRTLERTIFAYIGTKNLVNAFFYEGMQERKKLYVRILFPSIARDFPVSYISPKDQMFSSIVFNRLKYQVRICYGNTSYCDHGGSGVKSFLYVFISI